MFTPREVQSFIKMLDVLSDPVKAKAVALDLEAKAETAETALNVLQDREEQLKRRETKCKEIETTKDRVEKELADKAASVENQRKHVTEQTIKLSNEMNVVRLRKAAVEERESFFRALEEKLNERDGKLAEAELRVAAEEKEVREKLAELDNQRAQLKAIVG